MDNKKGWLVELLCAEGCAIVEKNLDQISNEIAEELKNIYKHLQKWIDINDDKVFLKH